MRVRVPQKWYSSTSAVLECSIIGFRVLCRSLRGLVHQFEVLCRPLRCFSPFRCLVRPEKVYSSKTCSKVTGGGMHPPPSPVDPPLDTNCDETFTSQKANQWKRNNLLLESKIVGRHYSCKTYCVVTINEIFDHNSSSASTYRCTYCDCSLITPSSANRHLTLNVLSQSRYNFFQYWG